MLKLHENTYLTLNLEAEQWCSLYSRMIQRQCFLSSRLHYVRLFLKKETQYYKRHIIGNGSISCSCYVTHH